MPRRRTRFQRRLRRLRLWLRHLPRLVQSRLRPAAPRRRVILHIGPHKTGTSSIQAMLHLNRRRLAPQLYAIGRREYLAELVCTECRRCRSRADLERMAPDITRAASRFARSVAHLPAVLLSHEDLLGLRPGWRRRKGLYRLGVARLRLIVDAIEATGAEVTLVFYEREFTEWAASLQRDLVRDPARQIPVARYCAELGFPRGWRRLIARFRGAFGQERFVTHPFDADRAEGRMGAGLLRIAGVSEDLIGQLRWPAPKRVTSAETLERNASA